MEQLSFYDVKTKGKFNTTEYKVQEKSGRYFAVAKSSAGQELGRNAGNGHRVVPRRHPGVP